MELEKMPSKELKEEIIRSITATLRKDIPWDVLLAMLDTMWEAALAVRIQKSGGTLEDYRREIKAAFYESLHGSERVFFGIIEPPPKREDA